MTAHRVLHVFDHSIPLHSGYTFRSREILRHQRAMGWETLHLTSPKHGPSAAAVEDVDGLKFYRSGEVGGIGGKLPILNQYAVMHRLTRRLEQVAREVRPQILHAHSPSLNGVAAVRVGRKLGLPVVYEVRAFWEDAAVDHGTSSEGGLRYRLTRDLETWVLRRADAVTTICQGLRGAIIEERGVPAERVTVVPNAVDITRFTPEPNPDRELAESLGLGDGPVVGFIGSFYAYEGLDLLVESLPRLLKQVPEAKLLMVGGGFQDEKLRALVAELGLGDRVAFTGRVPHNEVGRYYDLVDVFAYPRRAMRLTNLVTPLKPLEAMASGRLVVASDVGGHKELIRDRETGYLCPADHTDALADTLAELLSHPERWPELKANGRRFVEQERNWGAVVANYKPVYDRLVPSCAAEPATA